MQTCKNQDLFEKGYLTAKYSKDKFKLKALADNEINPAEKTKLMVENIVGKGENAGYQHFLLFP